MTRQSLFAASTVGVLLLGAAACGESSSPDPRGALHYFVSSTLTNDRPANMVCNSIFQDLVYLPDQASAPSDARPGTTYANGENGLQVSCTVAGADDGFSVQLKFSNGDTQFALRGDVGADGQGSGLTMDLSQLDWFGSLSSRAVNGQACTLTTTGGGYFIERGAVYGSFDCPVLTSTPDTACRVTGHVFFEQCSG